jgi:hypothetical protein
MEGVIYYLFVYLIKISRLSLYLAPFAEHTLFLRERGQAFFLRERGQTFFLRERGQVLGGANGSLCCSTIYARALCSASV